MAALIVVDRSRVRAGRLAELKRAMTELAGFIQDAEPRVLGYDVFFTQDGQEMTVVQSHPDSDSMERHMTIAGPRFAGFRDLVQLVAMDIYGRPGPKLLEQLQAKVKLLGAATLHIHDAHAGISRAGPPDVPAGRR